MRITSLCTALGAAVIMSLCSPTLAHAAEPSEEQLEAAKEHFGKGRELYDKGDKKGAVEEFKLAYRLSKNALLLYNVGLVYDELGEKALALHYYEKFLKEAPDNDKAKDNKKLASARAGVLRTELSADDEPVVTKPVEKPVEKPIEKPVEKPRKPSVSEFTHVTLDEAPPGKPIDLAAQVPDESGWRLSLYYRPQGKDTFVAVKMKPRFQELVGRIPADVVKGQSMQYYIEVKDAAGKLVAQSGSPASPNIVYLEPKAKAHYYRDAGGASAEQAAEAAPVDDGKAGEGIDDENPLAGGRGVTPQPQDGGEDLIGGGEQPGGGVRDGKVNWVKWGTTGGAAALLGTSVVLYFTASSYATQLEEDTERNCTPSPCQFDSYAASLEQKGRDMELWSNITLGAGIATAAVAGYFWYKDLKRPKATRSVREPSPDDEDDEEEEGMAGRGVRLMAAPMLGPGVVGGAAVIQF